MKPNLIYPRRKRCRACRAYFGFLVVDGMYCSYACAGRPKPDESTRNDWPRQHYKLARPRYGSLEFGKVSWIKVEKKAFPNQRIADLEAKRCGKQAYRCSYCNRWHIGSGKGGA